MLVIVLAAAYIVPGLIGHDPWKQDEAYVFGNIYHILRTGDWVVPQVAGEPFLEKPPLFYLVGAALATLSSPVLALHDGARLASGVFVVLALVALGWSAFQCWGTTHGRGAVLLMLSCLGLLVDAHMMVTDLALLAGFATAVAGFVACHQRFGWGGVLLGTGAGMAFLAKGLIGPGVIGATAVILPIIYREWRNGMYLRQLGWAAVAALPWIAIWPTALYVRSPELFRVWFWENNIGRFFGFSVAYLGAPHYPGFWWKNYGWFLFPAWLFVAVLLWTRRRGAWREPAVQIGVTLTVVMALVLGTAASARPSYAQPMILAMALVGGALVAQTPRWIEMSLGYAGIALGAFALGFFWPIWALLVTTGHAPAWARLERWLPLDFAMPVSFVAVTGAMLLSFGAVTLVFVMRNRHGRGLAVFCGSLALFWGLAMTLWLPWIDAAKSYRSVFQQMHLALPEDINCIASRGLQESERAMLDYVLDIRTQREEISADNGCDVLLVENGVTNPERTHLDQVLVWSGSRPGDRRERFDLYVRNTKVAASALH